MSKIISNPPAPGTEPWIKTVSASKVSTILGLNPWQTEGELWMLMSGMSTPDEEELDRWAWGHIAEGSLAQWWKHRNPGWQLSRGEVAYTDETLPFSNLATLDRRARRGRKFHIVECKTSDSRATWPGEDTLPKHVYAQTLSQMGISGIHEASVVAQVYSTVPVIYPVQWDKELWEGIVDVCNEFVKSLGKAEPPVPEPALVEALSPAVAADDVVELAADDVEDIIRLQDSIAELEEELNSHKSRLISAYEGKKLTVNGKAFLTQTKGRFSTSRVQENAKHLMSDPDVQTLMFDKKKFAAKYPGIYEAAVGHPSYALKRVAP